MPQLDNANRNDMGGKIDAYLGLCRPLMEPRLADAIASYIEGLQNSVEGASEVDALLNSLTASR